MLMMGGRLAAVIAHLSDTLGLVGASVLLAFVFAKVEIHIEGADGWAAKLPTWRIERHRLLDLFFGGRPLTGYHVWLLSFMLLMFHFPLVATWSWSWRLEGRVIAAMILFWILEDLLWFVLNPAWGWSRFNRSTVGWHKRWLWRLPQDYWVFGMLAGFLLYWVER
jgi:hypothetical protein